MHFDQLKRRQFITLLGSASATLWSFAAMAQQPNRVRRIGWMDSFLETDLNAQARVKAFHDVMDKAGWSVGRNLTIDYRWGLFELERARLAGAELLALGPDLMLCGGTPSAVAMKEATQTLPIVFAFVTDPVGQGIVPNLAHPGGNITGFAYFEPSVGAKWLGLLKELAPSISRVSFIFNTASSPYSPLYYKAITAAAPRVAVEPVAVPVHDLADVEEVMTRRGRELGNGIIFSPDAFLYANRGLIIEWAARHRLPAIYGLPGTAAEGGLIYYVVDIVDLFRQAASYIDRILRGEKPGELPVQHPTKFHMSINLKVAQALGLSVPNTLLVSADEIFE